MIKKRRSFRYENWKIITTPNLLTFVRIALLPFLIFSFFLKKPIGEIIALFIFFLASITDYADGYVARRLKQASKFGSFLDPIADKLLISVTILMLAGNGRITSYNLIPACIILCRELVISGLREFLSAIGAELPVIKISKYKTVAQMVAVMFLLGDVFVGHIEYIKYLGNAMLWAASILTFITGIIYTKVGMDFIKTKQIDKNRTFLDLRRKNQSIKSEKRMKNYKKIKASDFSLNEVKNDSSIEKSAGL